MDIIDKENSPYLPWLRMIGGAEGTFAGNTCTARHHGEAHEPPLVMMPRAQQKRVPYALPLQLPVAGRKE